MRCLIGVVAFFTQVFYINGIFSANIPDIKQPIDSIARLEIATKCYNIYLKGVEAESKCDTIIAFNYYNDFLLVADRPDEIKLVEIDLLCRLINIAYNKGDFENVCKYCQMAISLPSEILNNFDQTSYIYITYASVLNLLNKSSEIEQIINSGQYYVEKSYGPTEKEYYSLKLQQIMAYINMAYYNRAYEHLTILTTHLNLSNNHIIDEEISFLKSCIQKINDIESPLHDKSKFLDDIIKQGCELALFSSIMEDKGISAWDSLFSLITTYLKMSYFDTDSIEEEMAWSKLIYYYNVFINVFCKIHDIEKRSEYEYDYILTTKNFLSWHSAKELKKYVEWRDIKDSLDENEVAIEIIPHTKEALIIKRDFDLPKIINIDSILIDKLNNYAINDAYSINDFYKIDSPLSDLADCIISQIGDVKRLYISAANAFSLINYSCIPYKEGILDDYFSIIQLTSTSEIPNIKSHKYYNKLDNIVLFGGVNYGNTMTKNMRDSAKYITLNLRKGYDYLPYSLKEVNDISSLCNQYKCKYTLFTGNEASKHALLNQYYPKSSILHIATHTYLLPSYKYNDISNISYNNERSRLSTVMLNTGFLFSGINNELKENNDFRNNGLLTAKEISNMNLSNVELAVLSSCSSALGDVYNVTGIVYGLVNAFKSSGVNQVLVSLWDLPDETTAIFMHSFYDNLFQGFSPRKSIKKARQSLIEEGFIDPYYWAAFVILE
ncbi:CHAT domain-containing protein [uncultured Duncaniella sp.]|uniref:CHAT domain-containing protein n=1 Tax=uncultured Duncaniella sp. TaxID=2768039 RepID=UPI002613889B|nr:CHAT domain-containing protein [uncultured Duncaniella sp.]